MQYNVKQLNEVDIWVGVKLFFIVSQAEGTAETVGT